MKYIVSLIALAAMVGCSPRALIAPNWDKAETERKQAKLMARQVEAVEQIARDIHSLVEVRQPEGLAE